MEQPEETVAPLKERGWVARAQGLTLNLGRGPRRNFLTNRGGIAGNLSMIVLSLGQLAEIVTMFVLGTVLARLGWKTTMIVGILGFVPGVTSHFDQLRFAGHRSRAEILGVFDASILHNLLHLTLGVAGLWLARTLAGTRLSLLGGGAAYLVLWLYGLIVDRNDRANFIPVDSADNWLHLTLGLTMVAAGIVTGTGAMRRTTPGPKSIR